MHVALFQIAASINIIQGLVIFSLPFLAGLFFGYINEKKSDGSLIPSWLMHGIGNVVASAVTMFNLSINN
jgi:membrane protease YdiL (CAAX protease family)